MLLEHQKFLKSNTDFSPKCECNYLAMIFINRIRQSASNAHLADPVSISSCHPYCDVRKGVSGETFLAQ
jgi:hypothetical protein